MALVSILLLASGITLCVAEDNDLVILTTANQLRKEIRSQLNEALAEALPVFISNDDDIAEKLKNHTQQSVENAVRDTVNDVITPLLSTILYLVTPGLTPGHPATSCKEILQVAPDSTSGLYWTRGRDGAAKHVYCDMERSCKGVAGGWMRVASLDMTDSSNTCPSGLRTLPGPPRLCAMNIDGAGCSSTTFSLQGVQYSRVCGKIIGYQQKTPDAFWPFIGRGQTTIDSYYVEGISLTHGRSPRKHIWTFAAALHEYNSGRNYVCPCTNTRNTPPPQVPPFVGDDYFCDTGSENHYQHIFYGDDPLWNGDGCGEFNTCCSWNSPPWFMKQLFSTTTDDIEMRLCANQNRNDEDITFETLEIYVQ